MHVELGGYHIRDIVAVAAFDVDQTKVGTDLGKAMYAGLNNTIRFAEVGELGVTVLRGPTFDGLGQYYREVVEESPAPPVDVAQALRDAKADVLVSYLPVGSEQAQRYYCPGLPRCRGRLRQCHPGVHRVGAGGGPASSATPVCRSSVTTSRARSGPLSCTASSPVFSRTADWPWTTRTSSTWAATWTSKNMLERDRLESKKVSKTQAVTSQIEDSVLGADDVHIGPSDHVPWLKGPQVGLHPHGRS